MENNNKITFASIKERKEHRIDMESSEPHSECCIYKVPKDLRRVNEAAYTPQVISIGPLHHGKPELLAMEKQKIRYRSEFNQRIHEEKWQEFVTFIETNEQRVRKCYEDIPNISKVDFIAMILYDVVFVIELFLICHHKYENDFLLRRTQVTCYIALDLELLENQLPYFILSGLYMLAFPKSSRNGESYPSFFSLSCEFFHHTIDGIAEEVEVKHFVDLRRYVTIKNYPKPKSMEFYMDFPSALKLQGSGVKFEGRERKGLLEINFEKKKLRNCLPIPCMKTHDKLQIPLIEVADETEHLIRNVMALEQCHYPAETHVCNYIEFMDNLINTEEDVSSLVEARIISNGVGDTARIAKMFNQLCLQIDLSPSCYNEIVKELKAHYDNPWNHAKSTLKRVYFSNLWKGTATIAAIFLLLLTLVQTTCSVFGVV